MNSTNNKVLFILPYYNPFLNEGAKNRMDTFMDIAYRNGYNVFAVVGLNASYYFKSFFKKPLIREYNWIILPFFGMFRNFFFHAITLLLFRLTIKMLYSKNTFIFCQAETTVGGYLAVQTKKTPLVIDYHGDILDEMICFNSKVNSSGYKYKSVLKVIKDTAKKKQHAIFVSSKMRNLIFDQTKTDLKDHFIFPCVTTVDRKLSSECREFKTLSNGRIVLGYLGGLQPWQNVDKILDVIISLHRINDKILFALFTPHSPDSLKEKLDSLGSKNYYIKNLSPNEVPSYLTETTATIILRDNRPLNWVSSPTKIRESLSLGIPVIATKYSGDIESVVTHEYNGFIFSDVTPQPDEIVELNNFILHISKEKELFKKRCIESVRNQTKEFYEKGYLEFIKKIISQK